MLRDLHSTLVLLKENVARMTVANFISFTFYFSSIKRILNHFRLLFLPQHLHSTLVLLKVLACAVTHTPH